MRSSPNSAKAHIAVDESSRPPQQATRRTSCIPRGQRMDKPACRIIGLSVAQSGRDGSVLSRRPQPKQAASMADSRAAVAVCNALREVKTDNGGRRLWGPVPASRGNRTGSNLLECSAVVTWCPDKGGIARQRRFRSRLRTIRCFVCRFLQSLLRSRATASWWVDVAALP